MSKHAFQGLDSQQQNLFKKTGVGARSWSFPCTCSELQTLPGGAGTSANHSHMSADTFCAGCEGVRPTLQKSAQDKAPSALTHSPHCG